MFKVLCLLPIILLSACGFIAGQLHDKAMEEQLLKPGALDLPLTGFYSHYQYRFLDKYRVSHQWLRESSCEYGVVEVGKYESKDRLTKDRFFNGGDIFEADGSTWQRFPELGRNYNFDRFVRSVKRQQPIYAPATKEEAEAGMAALLERVRRSSRTGVYENPPPSSKKPIRYEETEIGYRPICFQSWWVPSNYVRMRLQKRTLSDIKQVFSERYPEGVWTTRTVNNQVWQVQETAEDKMRNRPPNGVGGPYLAWLLPIGDADYTMAFELGASKESLQYPEVLAKMRTMFMRLIESVSIEPIESNNPASAGTTSLSPCEAKDGNCSQRQTPEKLSIPKQALAAQQLPATLYNIPNEYPDRPTQLKQQMEFDSRHEMNRMLRYTMP